MRKKSILISILLISTIAFLPVYAKKGGLEYRANGKLVIYTDSGPGAEVVNGRWSIKVKDGEVDFKAFYRERNLDPDIEESPAGTIDEFWIYLDNLIDYEITDDTCVLRGDFHVDKKKWILPENPEYPPRVEWLRPQATFYDVEITIDKDDIVIPFWGGLAGPTLAIQYYI